MDEVLSDPNSEAFRRLLELAGMHTLLSGAPPPPPRQDAWYRDGIAGVSRETTEALWPPWTSSG